MITSYQTEKEFLQILEINKMGQEKEESEERFEGSGMERQMYRCWQIHSSPDGSGYGIISKITGPSGFRWTRETGPKRIIVESSRNKNYLPWFSRFKFRNKICKSSWTGLCGDRPGILVIRLTTSITARLGPPVRIWATDGWPGTTPQ